MKEAYYECTQLSSFIGEIPFFKGTPKTYLQQHDRTKEVSAECIKKISTTFANSQVPRTVVYTKAKEALEEIQDSPTERTASKVSAALLEYSRKGRAFTDPPPRTHRRDCVIL